MYNSLSSHREPSSSNSPLETTGKDHGAIEADKELTQRLTLTATRAVLPSDDLSFPSSSSYVSQCLAVMPSVEPGLCFSNHPPTESVAIYLSRPVPPSFIEGLRNVVQTSHARRQTIHHGLDMQELNVVLLIRTD